MGGRADKIERSPTLKGGVDPVEPPVLAVVSEVRLLRALLELQDKLRAVGDVRKALSVGAKYAAALFGADACCIGLLVPGRAEPLILDALTPYPHWPGAALGRFARGEAIPAPPSFALARLKRRRRAWGTLALHWIRGDPNWESRNAVTRIAGVINQAVQELEHKRLLEVRSRIDRKIMEQLRPKDLFYQILDGLRSLTDYDHSAMLLTTVPGEPAMELAAEQLAWRKGKSARIGARITMPESLLSNLAEGQVWGYSRESETWRPWDDASPAGLPVLHDGLVAGDHGAPPAEAEAICAPLFTRDGLAAILRISAQHPGTLGMHESELVEAFLPQASVALQNSRRAESMHAKMIEAERKHAMAELARGVSHDINNALGAVLPLVQQMRADITEGRADTKTFDQDLEQVERSVKVCKRIFGGMLAFARRSAKGTGPGNIAAAVESALSILGGGLERLGVEINCELSENLPPVPTGQAELEQVILNLVSNARDALSTPSRGDQAKRVTIRAAEHNAMVRLEVIDTGCGIAPEYLPMVHEPFFTTKSNGNGLGLSICRSIAWQSQGRIAITSEQGRGTCVTIELPKAVKEAAS